MSCFNLTSKNIIPTLLLAFQTLVNLLAAYFKAFKR